MESKLFLPLPPKLESKDSYINMTKLGVEVKLKKLI